MVIQQLIVVEDTATQICLLLRLAWLLHQRNLLNLKVPIIVVIVSIILDNTRRAWVAPQGLLRRAVQT